MNRIKAPKMVLLGDTKQLDAVGAGTPFHALQNDGMSLAVMNEIRRQENPQLLEAVMATIKGDVHKAFDKVGENIWNHDREAPAKAAERWLSQRGTARRNIPDRTEQRLAERDQQHRERRSQS